MNGNGISQTAFQNCFALMKLSKFQAKKDGSWCIGTINVIGIPSWTDVKIILKTIKNIGNATRKGYSEGIVKIKMGFQLNVHVKKRTGVI